MEPVLEEIRRIICLNGVDVFEKLLTALRSEPTGIYKELADCTESTHTLYVPQFLDRKQGLLTPTCTIYVYLPLYIAMPPKIYT